MTLWKRARESREREWREGDSKSGERERHLERERREGDSESGESERERERVERER